MYKIENKENISEIIMHPTACVKCQIGKDWYKIEFDVIFIPADYYPDYMEINEYIMHDIDGKTLNIEQAVKMLYDHLKQYNPKALAVTANVYGNKVHFDVSVTIK